MLEKLRNLKNTFEGKLLTVVLFVALVLSLSSLLAYAVGGSVTEKPGAVQTEQIAVDEQMPPADDSPVLPVSTNTVEVNEASVVFEAENAYVSVRDQVISGKALTVLSRKEIQFTATANAGYAIESVTAQNKAQAIVPVVAVGGTFSIAAEFVDSTLVVSVKAVAVPDQKVPGVATTPLEEPKKDVLQGENAANENQTIYTVTFTVEGSAIRTEKVVDGGTCAEPLNPDVPAGKVSFLGWYQKMGGSVVASERFDFAAPIHSNTELVAKFSDKWAVLFTDAGGKVIQTQEIANNETAQSIGAIPPPAGQLFDAWYLNGEPYDFAMPVTSNLTLTPHFATSHYVYFVSKGSAVDPQLIKDGQKATVPPQPSREGYDFRYWSATEGGAAFAFETEAITADTVLYGVWEGKTVQYTVVYNFEKPNILGDAGTVSENYQFSSQQTKSAPAGSTVSADTLNQGGNLSPSTASDLYKYGYYAFGNDTVISGNGDTVLNVYYKRTVYTLVFDLSGGTMTFPITGGQVYKNKEYSFKAKYEQNIEPQWVSSKNAAFTKGTDAFLRWNGSYVTHRLTMTSDLCDLASRDANKSRGSVTFTASWGAVRNVQVNYWLQVSDDAALPADAQEKNGKWFSKNNLYTQKLSLGATSDLLPKSIGGFKPGVSQGSTRDIYNFYYDRLTYKISFAAMGGSSVASVPDVRFEAPLAKHRPADPTRPNYAFKGWYLDSEYKISFSFDAATMPSSDMMLYPKWESSQYAANFYAQVGDSTPVIAQGVSQGAFVKDPGTYVVGRAYEGLGEFQGWYWYLPHTSYLVSYSWEAPVSGNLQLYGRWKTTGFALTYSAGVGQGAVPIDAYEYALDTHASVKNAVLTLAGKSFIGWQIDGLGRTYYSGNILKMKGTTKLVARYINPASAVYLTFNANYGNPSATEQWTAEKNDLVTLPGSMFSRPGHEFAGWNTQSDGKGASYGVDVPLLMSGNTVLYAQWREAPPVMLTYRAEAGGSTNPGEELVNPATGTPSGSSATAATNYRFDGWYIDAALISTNGVLSKSDIDEKAKNPQGLYQATTFTAKFSPKDVTLHFADNRGEVGYKTGKYGSKIAAGAMASGLVIDIGSAKAMALNYLNTTTLENKEQLLAAVANIPSLESLASLGFSFAFDGWASQPANSVVDPDVAQGVAPTTLEVSYQEKAFNGKSLFAGDSETVYAHYAMKYTVKKYTVAYTRGEYGTFADQLTPGLLYGSSAPAFRGIPEGASGYVFERWEPSVVPTVTNNATYTAQWKADIAVIATVNKPEDVIYNGQEQKWMPHITDDKGVVLVEGRDYELSYSKDVVNVGTVTVTIAGIGGYTGVVNRTYKITPAELILKANDSGKIFGETDKELTATVSGLIGSETFTGSYDLSRVPGENAGNYAITVNNAVSGNPNYTVTVVAGTFAITAADAVSVIVSSATKPYDGTPLVPSANTPVGLRPGDSVAHLDYIGTLIDVGTTAASAENIKINDAAGNDVTGNYRGITVVPGALSVTPVTLTIAANNTGKIYGAADPALTATVSGLIGSETFTGSYDLSRVPG
ncbi:MAG: InlB B-repeat-containing protein, partial [Raoultibacter sp.]